MRDFLDRNREKWAYLVSASAPTRQLAIFVHGYTGDYLGTWGKLPQMLLQEADARPVFQDWDYVFLGYSTKAIDCCLDIARRIATEIQKAQVGAAPYRAPYERFALFGHSLGTLGIRQLLCAAALHTPPNLLQLLHSVTLFGTPVNGSPWAKFGQVLFDVSDALKPESPQLRMLKVWTDGAYRLQPWPATRVMLGLEDAVVGSKFADLINWAGDTQAQTVELGHLAMVKPNDWNSAVIDYVTNALRPQPV